MPQNTARRTHRSLRLLLGLLVPLLLAGYVFYLLYEFLSSHVEGDQAYLLYAAQRVLAGVPLDGSQLVETNPPLIVWFSCIPAGLGALLHCSPVLMVRLVVISIMGGSAAWSWRAVQRSYVRDLAGKRLLLLFLASTYFAALTIHPAEFGQREQLLLALLLPYVFAVGTGSITTFHSWERVGVGAAAGLGVCFKPHHVLTLAAVELFLLVYRRSARRLASPELIFAIAVGLVYVAAVRLFTPAYLLQIVPLLTSTYPALGQYSLMEMILHIGRGLSLVLLLAWCVWLWLRLRGRLQQLSGVFLASSSGAAMAYFVQHTGWYHQEFPAKALMEMAALCMALDVLLVFYSSAREARPVSALVLTAFVLAAMLVFAGWRKARPLAAARPNSLEARMEQLPEGATVYVFTISLNAFPVVLERHLQWGSRFAHLWMLPAIVENESGVRGKGVRFQPLPGTRVKELAELQRRELTEDLRRTQPATVFVERCDGTAICDGLQGPLAFVPWFSQSHEFAQVWSQYRFLQAIDGFDVYTLQAN